MNLWDWYIRWRHSKGYGVHSPYAYRFITDVIRPGKYGYYAFEDLEGEIESRRLYKKGCFLIRLLNFLGTKRIVVLPSESVHPHTRRNQKDSSESSMLFLSEKVAKVTGKEFKVIETLDSFQFQPGDLLLAEISIPCDLFHKAINCKVPILAFRPDSSTRSLLNSPLRFGVLFNWKTKLLLIPRSEMHYVSYIL